jgi:D-3-phosphoglycerate dehydrogenase
MSEIGYTWHDGGAGVDMFDEEPIPAGHLLLAYRQVVLTPHNADQTPEGMELRNAGVVRYARINS